MDPALAHYPPPGADGQQPGAVLSCVSSGVPRHPVGVRCVFETIKFYINGFRCTGARELRV
jgi:hypothetical protein